MTKHVTVGFDSSPESYEALRWGALEAERRGCSLRIVRCYLLPAASDIHAGWVPAEAYSGLAQAASVDLEDALARVVATHPALEVETVLCAGPPASGLLDPRDVDEQLIVVGASSHRGASAFWLGSTPRMLVRRASCPVAVVRGAADRGGPQRVVVGIDDSRSAEHALVWAAAEADLHEVALHVVHAWEYPYPSTTTPQRQARDLTRVAAAAVLHDGVAVAREACRSEVVGDLVEGGPASGLLGAVRDGDLLVLGSRGRGAVRAGMFGSTVNSVLDDAVVPVVVVRTTEM